MGIKGLTKLISDNAPDAITEHKLANYTGRKIAIDAANFIYQFLVAVRSANAAGMTSQLTNDDGEVTSHLSGMFYRTIRLMANGVKPVYVFDGKAPDMKGGELAKRRKAKAAAQEKLKEAEKAGNTEEANKYSKQTVSMSSKHIEDCIKLCRLMGVPCVKAAGEAEAQCARLCAEGKVWAAASEDMDTLCFSSNILLRRLTQSESKAKTMPVLEIRLDKVLKGFKLTMPQFIDMCMLCGCDYLDTIKGVGPKTALKMIRKYGSLDKYVAALKRDPKSKKGVPDAWPTDEARKLFVNPALTPSAEIPAFKWNTEADVDGIIQFMCTEKGFAEERIRSGLAKLAKAKKKGSQKRIDSFFSFKPAAAAGKKKAGVAGKRKPGKSSDAGKGKKKLRK